MGSAKSPVALAVGGLDPCGGAGVLADARAMRAAGAWPLVVVAVSTVQTPRGLRRTRPIDKAWIRAQIDALAEDAKIRVVKTGALGDAADMVRHAILRHRIPFTVVDPVVRASRGREPLSDDSKLRRLMRGATLLTPNLPEAEALLGESIDESRAPEAASALRELGPRAVLLKGGHGSGDRVVDWLAHENGTVKIARPRLDVGEVHGTGCALASFIAGRLACRTARSKLSTAELTNIVRWGTKALNQWLRRAEKIGPGMRLLVG